jgi:serine protease Do
MDMNVAQLSSSLSEAVSEVVARVGRSLVVVHNGKHGAGAGISWRPDGYIVTNHHVIARGRVAVSLPDGEEAPARVVAQEPEIDLALLKIERSDLPVAQIADSNGIRPGQIVLAMGHPWGQRAAVTTRIISGKGKAQVKGKRGSIPVIRSDVLLAPGNSGGPLVDAHGAVLGINTMIVGGDLGVAIPSQVVETFVTENVDKDHP